MKTSIMAFVALLGHTSAENFSIINSCSTPVYFQFQPFFNGSASGSLNTLQPGQSWSEAYRRPHPVNVKIGTNETLDEYLYIDYKLAFSSSDRAYRADPDYREYIWYQFSTEHGNPFASHRNSLSIRDDCPNFLCKANETYECYSTSPALKVNACSLPGNLTAHLCE